MSKKILICFIVVFTAIAFCGCAKAKSDNSSSESNIKNAGNAFELPDEVFDNNGSDNTQDQDNTK